MIFISRATSDNYNWTSPISFLNNRRTPKYCYIVVPIVTISGLLILLTAWIILHKLMERTAASVSAQYDDENDSAMLPASAPILATASDYPTESQYANTQTTTVTGPS